MCWSWVISNHFPKLPKLRLFGMNLNQTDLFWCCFVPFFLASSDTSVGLISPLTSLLSSGYFGWIWINPTSCCVLLFFWTDTTSSLLSNMSLSRNMIWLYLVAQLENETAGLAFYIMFCDLVTIRTTIRQISEMIYFRDLPHFQIFALS